MQPAGATCPECGAPRSRRAAGCPSCGAIFDTVVTASGASATPRAEDRAAPPLARQPERDLRPRGRLGGCGACALLALILVVLTAGAGVALYVLARREFTPLVGQFEHAKAAAELTALGASLSEHARLHADEYPASLLELEQVRAAEGRGVALALGDPWDAPYGYELSAPRGPGRVYSLGADGRPGGEGADADLEVLVPAR